MDAHRMPAADRNTLILKALSNDKRLKILVWLKEPKRHLGHQAAGDFEPERVCAPLNQKKSALSQSTASSSLPLLPHVGLVKAKRVVQWTYYRRNEDAIRRFVDELEAALR